VILADSNVLLDLITNDPTWLAWSEQQLAAAAITGDLAINEVVFAELSVRFGRIEELNLQLEQVSANLIRTPPEALFLAGKAFERYRAAGGPRTGTSLSGPTRLSRTCR